MVGGAYNYDNTKYNIKNTKFFDYLYSIIENDYLSLFFYINKEKITEAQKEYPAYKLISNFLKHFIELCNDAKINLKKILVYETTFNYVCEKKINDKNII